MNKERILNMNKINLGGKITVPQIGLGTMRITGLSKTEMQSFFIASMELGINFFDMADIYGVDGACESHFADSIDMNPTLRDRITIQTKCGIRPDICYDLSKEHILKSVDESLKRLKTGYIDILLLHRPDALTNPEEIADAFSVLKQSGKVIHFGVSNQNPYQIALLSKHLGDGAIIANQMQMSIPTCPMIDFGLNVNTGNPEAIDRDNGTLDYCRLHDITIQAWSPFQYGFFEGNFIGSAKYPKLNKKLDEISEKYSVTPNAVAVAWLSRHPANIQTIVGTTSAQRLKEISKSCDFTLTREEWYDLYLSAGKPLP